MKLTQNRNLFTKFSKLNPRDNFILFIFVKINIKLSKIKKSES